jgi:uncharacterized protein YjiS (DUF1127 family)
METVRSLTTFCRSVAFAGRPELLARVLECDARFRARRALEGMGRDRLRDLGLTAADVEAEVTKPLWRA